MDWMLITTILCIVLAEVILASWMRNRRKTMPPGPRGLPILGNLLELGKNPHRDLHRLSQRHGPIMYLRLGVTPAVVVSSPEAAELFLKTHDLVFASRPPQEGMKHMAYNQKNLSFAPYGPYWRNVRRMVTLELLSNKKIKSFEPVREEEVGLLMEYLRDASCKQAAVNLSKSIKSFSADMSCRMILGKKYGDKDSVERGFPAAFQEMTKLSVVPNLGDFFPYLACLDLQGLTKRMNRVSKAFDVFLEKVIDEHLASRKAEGEHRDFVDVMLQFMGSDHAEYSIGRDNIKAIILDILIAASETSASLAEWIMSELIRHGNVMKKLQEELEEAVGMQRMVEESETESLEYLNMVIKEGLRLHPPAPLLLPHMATEDAVVNGFHIPRNSRVLINAWSIGRHPDAWKDPEEFIPERFQGSQIDVRGQHFQLLPFGAGRRGCAGTQLALNVVRFVVAQLVHCFDWQLPDAMPGTELDMTEEFGIVTSRAKDLIAVPLHRISE